MALERPPRYLALNPAGITRYRPPPEDIKTWHRVLPDGRESWTTIAKQHGVPVQLLIAFNFPGAMEDGRLVPEIVNWYLHHHEGFGCPETRDRKNRRFRGGERIAIPYQARVTLGKIQILPRPSVPTVTDWWAGVGESHSGDLVALGYFNWNAVIYRIGAYTDPSQIEWAKLSSHGLKLGGGLGASFSGVFVFAHGVTSARQLRSAFAWGDMDFDLAPGANLGALLKGLRGIGPMLDVMAKYKKTSYVAQEVAKNAAFMKPGVYTIPIPKTGPGMHVWVGRKYAETMVVASGMGL